MLYDIYKYSCTDDNTLYTSMEVQYIYIYIYILERVVYLKY